MGSNPISDTNLTIGMKMITVKNTIQCFEKSSVASITVESAYSDSEMVWLIVDDKKVCVSASDLEAAIKNATNTASFGRSHW